MNHPDIERAADVVEQLLQSQRRADGAVPQRYWYPLSLPTYGTPEILEALDSMCSFRTTMREKTRRFEKAFSAYQGGGHAVMVNSGSSADLLLTYLLVDPVHPILRPGDHVLVPAVTWPTQVWSALMAGLRVELVDVDPGTLNVSVEDLERRITPSTRALFLVHLLGNPCEMDRILALARKHQLVILEDCCEALGAEWRGTKVGNFGIGAAYSFFFSHHITTMEGGMVSTREQDVADRLRILRAHGWFRDLDASRFQVPAGIDPRYAFVDWGFNFRPTELQAGFGLRQLEQLPAFTERRRSLAARYFAALAHSRWLSAPLVAEQASPIWMALPCMVAPDAPFGRGELVSYLEEQGVETRPIVAGNLARQPVASRFPDLVRGTYPGADAVHEGGFYVGLSPMVQDEAMERLIQTFERFLARYR